MVRSCQDSEDLPVAAIQEIDLEIKRPAPHVVVEVDQVGVVVGRFIMDLPTKGFAKLGTEGGFSRADISGDRYVLDRPGRIGWLFHVCCLAKSFLQQINEETSISENLPAPGMKFLLLNAIPLSYLRPIVVFVPLADDLGTIFE